MHKVIKLSRNQTHELFESLLYAKENGRTGLHSLRICVDGDTTVDFKINEEVWSGPRGQLDENCRMAARARVDRE